MSGRDEALLEEAAAAARVVAVAMREFHVAIVANSYCPDGSDGCKKIEVAREAYYRALGALYEKIGEYASDGIMNYVVEVAG